MKCEICQGTGLESELKVCPVCNGLGVIGDEDIEHIVTEEEVEMNNLKGKVKAGDKIRIPKSDKKVSKTKKK